MFALVLPGEVVAFPDVGPTVAARVLPRAALEAVVLAGRVGFGGSRLIQQPAQVDEVLLRRRPLLKLRRPPLRDELVWSHASTHGDDALSGPLAHAASGRVASRSTLWISTGKLGGI